MVWRKEGGVWGCFPQETLLDRSLNSWGKFARWIWGGGERACTPSGGSSTFKGPEGCFLANYDSDTSTFVRTDFPRPSLASTGIKCTV